MKSNIFSSKFWMNFIKKQPSIVPEELVISESETQTEIQPQQLELPIIKEQKEEPLLPILVQSELNLEKNVIFTVSAYKGKSREIIHTDKLPDGSIIKRTVVIGKTKSGIETGILTIYHFKIYLALVELWEKAGRPANTPIHFTTYKLLKRLDLSDDGRTYERVKTALYELRQIPIEFIHSFYMPQEDSFSSLEPLSILNHLRTYERKKAAIPDKVRGYGQFQFDRYIIENILSDYVHPLRLDVVKSFKHHKDLSILIYTYLDRQLAYQNKFEIGLKTLFDNLDLSQDYVRYPAERKRVIEPVLAEIQGKALSTGMLTQLGVYKTKDGNDYKLVARKFPFKMLTEAPNSYIERQKTKITDEDYNDPFREQITEYRKKLSPDDREKLRERATEELKNTPGILDEFITDILIEVKENAIIRILLEQEDEESKA